MKLIEYALFGVRPAGCGFSPGLTVVDPAVACVWALMPPERSPVPAGSAVLKKRGFPLILILRALVDL